MRGDVEVRTICIFCGGKYIVQIRRTWLDDSDEEKILSRCSRCGKEWKEGAPSEEPSF